MAITKYGYNSPIVKNLAGYQDTYKKAKPRQVIPYLSQGYAAKPAPRAAATPGFQLPPGPIGSLAAPATASVDSGPNSSGYTFAPQPQQQQRATFDPNVNYESDPVLQKIRLAARGQRDTAQSAARTRKVALATQLGDTGFASELGLSAAEQAAAGANPLSDLAQLGRTEQKSTTSLEDALNKSNLYFSGHRGTQLGELARNFLGQRAGALGAARQGYSGILGDLLGAQGSADQMEMDAEAAAYGRALDAARAGGGTPPVGSEPGTPPDVTPPAPPDLIDRLIGRPDPIVPLPPPPGGGRGDIGAGGPDFRPPAPGSGGVGAPFMGMPGGATSDAQIREYMKTLPWLQNLLAGGVGPASKIRGFGGAQDLLSNLLG